MNKKVLIITRDFPPNHYQIGWMIRMAALAAFFHENSIEVHVIAIDSGVSEETTENLIDVPDDVHTYFILSKQQNKIHKYFKKLVFNINKYDRNLLKKILCKCSEVIDKHGIKNIIISSPPGNFRILSVDLRKKYGDKLNIIADYRDAWSLRWIYVKNKNRKELAEIKNIEQKSLYSNTINVFVSEGMKKQYEENFEIKKSIVIENGFIEYQSNENLLNDEIFINYISSARKKNKIVIVYCGSGSVTGNGHKDFKILFELISGNSYLNSSVCFVIIGNVNGLSEYEHKLDFYNAGVIPNHEVSKYFRFCDLGLTVHSHKLEAPAVMGGKIYDYLAASLPIWFIVPENAYSIKHFIEKHDKGFLSDINNRESIEKRLNEIITGGKSLLNKNVLSTDEIVEYKRSEQYKKYEKLLI